MNHLWRQGTGAFQLESIDGMLEGGFLTDLQDRTRSTSSGSEFNRVELSQLLHLNTFGYIYHPRFLTFDTGLKLEAIQGLSGQSDTRFLWGGDFRINFLENHRNSLSLFGTVLDSEQSPPFSETYDITNQIFGATFFQKWGWIPFDLTYRHARRKGGAGNQLDDKSDKVIFDGRYSIGERSDGRIGYDLAYEEIQDHDLRRQNLIATNVSYFGDGVDKELRTDLRLFEERDGQKRKTANGRTAFDWRHTDTFRTRYVFNARYSDFDVQDSTNLNGRFFLMHRLYESLKTDLELYGEYEDSSFRRRDEFGGILSANYLKRLGDWGRLNIGVAPRTSMIYNRLEEDTAFVFDERHVMVGLQPVLLRQPDIIVTSIVVTDETGSVVYDEGPAGDYIVNQTGGGIQTELVRTPISTIGDGQLVLVDYEFELIGDNDTLQTGVAVHSSLSFLDYWRVFGRYDNQDYHVISGDEDRLRFNDFDRYLAGLEFSRKWFTAKGEYEENDATFGSFRGFAGMVALYTGGMRSWNAHATADFAHRDHTDDVGEKVNRFSLSGGTSKRFFKWGMLEAEASWMRARWSGQSSEANDVDALRVKLKYTWWYENFEVKLETGFAQLLRPTEDRSVFRFDLRARRVF
ncbi:MAG: hypothetical protein JRF15_02900, partial [Deltaproteobacteria bacterium]|jgi:hypothetical protein|nr:hypothetical protein [Deltaproteobacteria bacterium]